MLTLDNDTELALEASANALIVNALTHGAPPRISAPVIGEVKAAHATVIAGASQAAVAWASVLAPLKIQVTSTAVLIHASPKVSFRDVITNRRECRELGDLLIVIDHRTGSKVVDRRAVLVQAKLADSKGGLALGSSGVAQRNLYLRWPSFTMPAGYASHARDLADPTCKGLPAEGCRFGGIHLHGSRRDWKQIRTMQSMNTYSQPRLGSFLMRMACGRAGREAVDGGTDPWSILVDELLRVTFKQTFPSRGGLPRYVETLTFLVGATEENGSHSGGHSAFFTKGSPPGQILEGDVEFEPPLGISTIHIELSGTTDVE